MQANGSHWFEYEDNDSVLYMADQDSATTQLYRVNRAAPCKSTRLNGHLVANGSVWSYRNVPWSLPPSARERPGSERS